MCANFKPITAEQVIKFDLPKIPFDYDSEIYPSYNTPLLFKSKTGLEWRSVNFGLVPKWATDKADVKSTYNARNETISEKISFQEAFHKHQFGVIPVTEFYEMKYVNGRAQRWGVKRKDGQAFYIAELYEIVKIKNEIIRSATMITMDAVNHEMMKHFHESGEVKRSVIIIPHTRLMEWLNLQTTDIQSFVQGFPVDEFEDFYCPKPRKNVHPNQIEFF